MPIVERNDRRIHYTVTGEGPGLLLVPGLGSGARLFGTLPRRFAREGFTCAAVDPVGLPPSGPLPGGFSFAEAAADVLAVAAMLPAPVALVGTSLGGKVALAAAATAATGAIGRLVLLCSAASASPRARRVYRYFELIAGRAPDLLAELTAPFLFGATFHRQKPAVVDDIIRASAPTEDALRLMRSQCQALMTFDGEALARRCAVPTLCLAGAEDTLTPPDEVAATAALLPDATFRAIPGAGHSLLLESLAAGEQVLDFLRGG